MPNPETYVRVAVFAPLRSCLDYRVDADNAPAPGCRVKVPLGRGSRIGVVVAHTGQPELEESKIRNILAVLDDTPLIDPSLFELATWAWHYYRCAPGEAFEALFPTELRQGLTPREVTAPRWRLTSSGQSALDGNARLGKRQRELLEAVSVVPKSRAELQAVKLGGLLSGLAKRGWLKPENQQAACLPPPAEIRDAAFLSLSEEQAAACARMDTQAPGFGVSLLHGVTGSGKTEVYLHRVREALARGQRALVLVPEIGLTAQTVARFQARFGDGVTLMHSGLGDRERATAWQRCREGTTHVLLGTRSAIWMPLPSLGLIVVDEEHDASYKQQEGFRYSARDVAIVRARQAGAQVILGSATPSLESIANCDRGRFQRVNLLSRATGARLPKIAVIDVRGQQLRAGIGDRLRRAVIARAERGEQSLLFLNRRGYAPVVVCHHCGWIANCPRCDARLVLHREEDRLRCHHCGLERRTDAIFPAHPCGRLDDYTSLGVGTEQLEEALAGVFPGLRAVRVDRDAVRRKGELEKAFARVRAREVDLLIGTQMIAKGHDFEHVTLVGVIDGDSGLLARDFRAEERFVQMILQVAGRAGRAALPGEVMIQTHHPEHPAFSYLQQGDYGAFAHHALAERVATGMPPSTVLALLRAEAGQREIAGRFLEGIVRTLRPAAEGVFIGGPVPALMERRGGKFRANLLFSAPDRRTLSRVLDPLPSAISASPWVNRVRWHLDIDPHEIG